MMAPRFPFPVRRLSTDNTRSRVTGCAGRRVRVEITAHQIDPRFQHLAQTANGAPANELPKVQIIPEKYNKKSTLTLSVNSRQRIQQDFPLTK